MEVLILKAQCGSTDRHKMSVLHVANLSEFLQLKV